VKAFFNESITLKLPSSMTQEDQVQTGINMLQSYIYTCLYDFVQFLFLLINHIYLSFSIKSFWYIGCRFSAYHSCLLNAKRRTVLESFYC